MRCNLQRRDWLYSATASESNRDLNEGYVMIWQVESVDYIEIKAVKTRCCELHRTDANHNTSAANRSRSRDRVGTQSVASDSTGCAQGGRLADHLLVLGHAKQFVHCALARTLNRRTTRTCHWAAARRRTQPSAPQSSQTPHLAGSQRDSYCALRFDNCAQEAGERSACIHSGRTYGTPYGS